MKEQDNKPKFEDTALQNAVAKNDLEKVKRLLEQGDIDINARDPNREYTAMDWLAYTV